MKPLDVRRAEALARNAAWAALSPAQQLSSLEARGAAATAQRARLMRKVVALPAPAIAGGVIHPSDPKPEKPRHKKGRSAKAEKRGDGRRTP